MLAIRFLRIGRKHHPSYKIVVIDKRRAPKSGKFVEQLGFYNPITKEKGINKERIQYWLSCGAQLSDTVHNLLIKEGIIEGKKIAVHSTKKRKKGGAGEAPAVEGETKPTAEPKEEAPKEEVSKEESIKTKEEIKKEESKEESKIEEPEEKVEKKSEGKVEGDTFQKEEKGVKEEEPPKKKEKEKVDKEK